MITIGMHYDVVAGKEAEFEAAFAGVLKLLGTWAGHTDSHLYRDVHAAGSYVILSQWQSKQAFEAFLHSPQFKQTVAWGKAEILRSRPRHRIYLDG